MYSVASLRRRSYHQAMNGFFLLALVAAVVMPFGKTSVIQWGTFGFSAFCITAFAVMYFADMLKRRKEA